MNTKKRTIYMKRIIISLALSAIMIICSVITVSAAANVTDSMSNKEIIDLFYPVGSYFETTDGNFNPNNSWSGTTWEKVEDGRVLIASNSTYTLGSTGGEATHALTPGETAMRSHTHGVNAHTHSIPALSGTSAAVGDHAHQLKTTRSNSANGSGLWTTDSSSGTTINPYVGAGGHSHTVTTTANNTGYTQPGTGGITETNGSAHNNMQPYMAVKRWRRTA